MFSPTSPPPGQLGAVAGGGRRGRGGRRNCRWPSPANALRRRRQGWRSRPAAGSLRKVCHRTGGLARGRRDPFRSFCPSACQSPMPPRSNGRARTMRQSRSWRLTPTSTNCGSSTTRQKLSSSAFIAAPASRGPERLIDCVDHRVGGLCHRLLQVAGGIHRQGQARVGGQRRQFAAGLPAAGLHLATVGVDRLDQLRLVGGTGGRCERQPERQYGQTRDAWDCHGNLLDLMAPMMRDSAARRRIRPEPGAGVAGSGRRFGERLHQPLDHRADPRGVAQVAVGNHPHSYGRRRSRCGQTRTSPSRSPMYSGAQSQATRQGLAHHHVGIHRDDHPAVADRLAAQGQFALAVPIGFVHHRSWPRKRSPGTGTPLRRR